MGKLQGAVNIYATQLIPLHLFQEPIIITSETFQRKKILDILMEFAKLESNNLKISVAYRRKQKVISLKIS